MFIVQLCPVFTVCYSDPALRIELLISWAFLFCSVLYPGSISEVLINYLGGGHPCERQIRYPCMDSKREAETVIIIATY